MMGGRGGRPLTELERAITRRRAIALMGAAGLAAVAAACTTDQVFTVAPYDERPGPRTPNDQDSIYANGGPESTLGVSKQGDGYVGSLTMGVRSP